MLHELNVIKPKLISIYKITHIPSEKNYVGQSKNAEERFQQHLSGKGSQKLLFDFVQYGINTFKFEILEVCNSQTIADNREDFYIEKYNCILNGYNLCYNRVITPNGDEMDMSNIVLCAKYVFNSDNDSVFTIGMLSQSLSYQTAVNVKELCNDIKQKNQFNFDYIQLNAIDTTDSIFLTNRTYSLKLELKQDRLHVIDALLL